MKFKGLLFLSNGHGEDAINCQILSALRASGSDVDVAAMPIVGDGAAYARSGVQMIGPTSKMPSGGVFYMNPIFLVKDIGAGLIALTWQQLRAVVKTFVSLRFSCGHWGYCSCRDRPFDRSPLYNFSVRSF
ncbi:MAG: hypothetical protein P2A85_23935 [Microcoleus anatoxicus]|uniref:hypothetical protein n=1 Tax=Microcoleus anatoxicus TaxID=2705319 RepID=UPI0036701AA2